MASAKTCPFCGRIFNPKFGGQAWGTQVICNDCFVRKALDFQNSKHFNQQNSLTKNQGDYSLN